MHIICCTRFNNNTYMQNTEWKEKNRYIGCIYNTSIKVPSSILQNTNMFVLEMNNDTNKILGIGLISNFIHLDKYYKIYSDGNYNRYTYKSTYRIDYNELSLDEKKIINVLEILLFKGSRHSKRGNGIQRIPKWITDNKVFNFLEYIHNLYKNHFMILTIKIKTKIKLKKI